MEKVQVVSEPASESWGGLWTKQKLDAFIDYVKAYLRIMKSYPYWKTIYFDGFAGSGERLKKHNSSQITLDIELDESVSMNEINLYKGSVQRILELDEMTFDYYYFIDTEPKNIQKINKLKKTISHIPENRIIARESDCNAQIRQLAKAFKSKKLAALVFLDPFGMQINWESIASLKGTRTDVWILIPSGVSVNRLLPRSGEVANQQKLEKFFGMEFNALHNFFYRNDKSDTLFGEMSRTQKLDNPIERVVELYKMQLKTIWKHVTEKPLVLKNTRNVPIFHFLFASNNENAMKIASQIIQKKQM